MLLLISLTKVLQMFMLSLTEKKKVLSSHLTLQSRMSVYLLLFGGEDDKVKLLHTRGISISDESGTLG